MLGDAAAAGWRQGATTCTSGGQHEAVALAAGHAAARRGGVVRCWHVTSSGTATRRGRAVGHELGIVVRTRLRGSRSVQPHDKVCAGGRSATIGICTYGLERKAFGEDTNDCRRATCVWPRMETKLSPVVKNSCFLA